MRVKIAWLGLGLFFLLTGLYLYQQTDVRCGGHSMRPGDSCEVTNNGHTTTLSYDQERSKDQRNNIIYMVLGGLVTAVGIGLVAKEMIDRRQPAASAPEFFGQPAAPVAQTTATTTTTDPIGSQH